MSLKEIIDLQLAVPVTVSNLDFPLGVMSRSVIAKQFIIVPTANVIIHAVDWGIVGIYNAGRNNEKEDLIARYTNKSDESDASTLTAWVPKIINANDVLIGKGELLKAKSEANGTSINLGIALQVLEIETIG